MKLSLLPLKSYRDIKSTDPLRLYFFPVVGNLYRKRIEKCLNELQPGDKILEIGFGSGISFLNLNELYNEIHGLDLDSSIENVLETFAPYDIDLYLRNGNVLDMPYDDCCFDSVLAISIFEHLQPDQLKSAFCEIYRVLKPGGQLVYGVPVDSPFMTFAFRLLGYDIHQYHFSDHVTIASEAKLIFDAVRIETMTSVFGMGSPLYEAGNFIKA